MHPLLDQEKQQEARQYEKEKRLLGLIGSVISFLFLIVFYISGLSEWFAFRFPDSHVSLAVLIYTIGFILLSTVVGFPLSYFSGFVHEKKWGFSNHTFTSWIWDETKSLLLSLVLFPLLLGLLLWIMTSFPQTWWLVAGSSMAVIGAIFATLFPVMILPLFNDYTPIDNEELTSRLETILEKVGLKAGGFFVEDMSRQTKKENAFLAGMGKTRRVVLGDNLMDHMSIPEIESVIAHEVGHYRYGHIWKNIFMGTIQQIILFFALHLVMNAMFPSFLDSTRWNLTTLPVFFLMFGVFNGLFFSPLNMAISRYFERQADRTSLELIENKEHFISAMAGLANRNLSNAYPSRWIRIFFYSHPPIWERLEFGEKY